MTAHVLFVDDDEANLVVWEAACRDSFPVLTAGGAATALRLLQTHEVAVLLADQRMPETTGVELLERVHAEHPDVIRILITAYSDLGAAVDAINRGHVRRYLRKPCALAELRSEISQALELYGLKNRVRAMERRLMVTERVYALGLVATSLGRELDRPATSIRDGIVMARTEIRSLTEKLDSGGTDVRMLRGRLLDLEERLGQALFGVERVVHIAKSVAPSAPPEVAGRVDLGEVLRLVLRIVRGELRRGAEIEIDVEAVPKVRGSSAKIGQVLLNLVVNALQSVADQPQSEGLVTIRFRATGSKVRLEVLDSGAGIPESDLARIFDPFHASAEARGTGVGLAISKAIVEELGGTIEAANRAHGGAAFFVELPADPNPEEAVPPTLRDY